MDGIEFQNLVKTFQDVEALPQLPESSFRLVQVCDDPDSTLHDAEQIVASDPGLTAMVLRSASSARFASFGSPATTVSTAVMRIGIKALKALAMVHSVRTLMDQRHDSDWYDARRLSGHSVFVAVTMQHLFDREFGGSKNDLEEVFAFGLLHDLGMCLLAHVAPDIFDATWKRAEAVGSSFDEAFHHRFHEHVSTLAWAASSAWRLPEIFTEFLHLKSTGGEQSDLAMAVEVLELAENLAVAYGFGFEPWAIAEATLELDAEEIESLRGAFAENWHGPSPFLSQAA